MRVGTATLWILDRERLNFLHAFPFANNNVFTSIDPKTGRPTVDESKRPGAHQGADFCPSIGGGKDWPPEAWSPQTKLLYIPANDNICAYLPKGEVPEADSRGFYVGYEVESIFGSVRTDPGRVRSHWRAASLGPEHRQASLAAQFQDYALVTAVGDRREHPPSPVGLRIARSERLTARSGRNCGASRCRPALSVFPRRLRSTASSMLP